ncbi:MAG: hypothetical protein NTX32_04470 [Candidatus Firestonebacteria bacterium]|nr:hypothetical protein [Candidatus Firestonebacteria bacterium]
MEIIKKKEAIKAGWELTKKNLGFAIVVMFVYMLISTGGSGIQALVEKYYGFGILYFNVWLIYFFFSIFLCLGYLKIFIQLYEGKKAELVTLFNNYEEYFDFLVCYILYVLIVMAGIVLFVIPGIIWALKYQFALYLVIDKKMKPLEAIRMSGKITMGHKVNLFLFMFVVLGVCILGFLCCCIGIIPAAIVVTFALIHIYKSLVADYENRTKNEGGLSLKGVSSPDTIGGEQNSANPISEIKPVKESQKPPEPPQPAI